MERTNSASIVALYHVLGDPSPHYVDPLSAGPTKTSILNSFEDEALGFIYNTRTMTKTLPDSKRKSYAKDIADRIKAGSSTILDIAQINGRLKHASEARPAARILVNAIWYEFHAFLQQQHAIFKRIFNKDLRWLKAPADWNTTTNTNKRLIEN